jgi:predicted secreted protein
MNSRLSRALIVMPLLASAALLSPASASAPARCGLAARAGAPTKFDYVVLASLADSSSLLSMSTYNISAPNK